MSKSENIKIIPNKITKQKQTITPKFTEIKYEKKDNFYGYDFHLGNQSPADNIYHFYENERVGLHTNNRFNGAPIYNDTNIFSNLIYRKYTENLSVFREGIDIFPQNGEGDRVYFKGKAFVFAKIKDPEYRTEYKKLLFQYVENIQINYDFLMHDTDGEVDSLKLIFSKEENKDGFQDILGFYNLKDLVSQINGVKRGYHFQIHGENSFSFAAYKDESSKDDDFSNFLVIVKDWEKGEIEYYKFPENVREFKNGFVITGYRKAETGRSYLDDLYQDVYRIDDKKEFKLLSDGNKQLQNTSVLDKDGHYSCVKKSADKNDKTELHYINDKMEDKVVFTEDGNKTFNFQKDSRWMANMSGRQVKSSLLIDGDKVVFETNKNKSSYLKHDKYYWIKEDNEIHLYFYDENGVFFKIKGLKDFDSSCNKGNLTKTLSQYNAYENIISDYPFPNETTPMDILDSLAKEKGFSGFELGDKSLKARIKNDENMRNIIEKFYRDKILRIKSICERESEIVQSLKEKEQKYNHLIEEKNKIQEQLKNFKKTPNVRQA